MREFDGHVIRAGGITIHYGEWNDAYRVALAGQLRIGDSAEAFDTVVTAANASMKKVVIDLAELRSADSRGLGALVDAACRLRGRLSVVNLTARLSEMLVLCRLLTALPIADEAAT